MWQLGPQLENLGGNPKLHQEGEAAALDWLPESDLGLGPSAGQSSGCPALLLECSHEPTEHSEICVFCLLFKKTCVFIVTLSIYTKKCAKQEVFNCDIVNLSILFPLLPVLLVSYQRNYCQIQKKNPKSVPNKTGQVSESVKSIYFNNLPTPKKPTPLITPSLKTTTTLMSKTII